MLVHNTLNCTGFVMYPTTCMSIPELTRCLGLGYVINMALGQTKVPHKNTKFPKITKLD